MVLRCVRAGIAARSRVDALDLSIEMLIHPTLGYRLELLHRPGSGTGRKPADTR